MSQIRLYIDEDSGNLSLVQALRNSSVEVMTTSDANRLSSSDEEQLIWATEQRLVIYTSNMGDFCRLHRNFAEQNRSHSGIIVATRQSYSIGAQLRGLLNLIVANSAEEMINKLEYLGAYIRAE
ncbi:MAG: DUF5615 family PIN-like protein [Oscillatoriales cyanobacterium RU_3_3]|nr:DUF5615 family PIN-like protein [Microcoleus sp. SU_5_6]NJL65960.1 DUF5615 family PIN-like protein [Microcoleus sp. SM1_3_4]NJM62816.1 DUF5615 family PIN-like protein [Oscillatoriales cyanobacterium RU_3_3]NJR21901.1 DUF5615 family PIN-like protein [Richelia sp. CSU_2_1]